ncbi:MAG: RNA polymerase sigma factor [Desulfobacteraceae bacterium]|nr:RNA polymerase sigma factor [Desulfobacteraceae bacterium]
MDFSEIYDEYYIRIRKFILTITKDEWAADDLLQETFIRVKKNLKDVKDASKLSSWIFRISYNLCMDHLNKKKRALLSPLKKSEPSLEIPILKKIEQQQMGDCVQEKIKMLKQPMRIIIDLYEIMEFTHKEIGEILSISEKNSKVRLHRARKELKAILNKECSFKYDERNILICEPVKQEK